jgi:hypothetical protein
VTVVKAGTFFDRQSAPAKLSSGQTDKSQKVNLRSGKILSLARTNEPKRVLISRGAVANGQVARHDIDTEVEWHIV